jgi:uncharacterized protein YgiM (DUF1202 family)
MGRGIAILSGILILALMAGGLTEAALALGHHGGAGDDTVARTMPPTPSGSPTPSTTPSMAPSPSVTPTPVATPVAAPAGKTAVTNSFVHMRAGKSIYSNILTDLNAGAVVEVLADSDAQWQQVRYNGLTGYIFKLYLTY